MTEHLPPCGTLNPWRELGADSSHPHHAADVLLGRADQLRESSLASDDSDGTSKGMFGCDIHELHATTKVVDRSTPHSVKPFHNGCCMLPSMGMLADRLRTAREAAGLSQTELARRAGVSQQTIDKIERGLSQRSRYIVEIAAELKVSAAYLRGLTDDPTPEPIRTRIEAELKSLPDDKLLQALQAIRALKA
nr:helix-turn-helix transcriptional regulator [Azospirillum baldaniorum]